MKILTRYIEEPQLEFNGHFLHVDKKTGLSEYGPFGRTEVELHPTQIRVGIVGTRSTVEMCDRWIDECRSFIETDKSAKRQRVRFRPDELFNEDAIVDALLKGLSPDFVGMSANSTFATEVITAQRWRSTFTDREATLIADLPSEVQRVEKASDLLCDHIQRIATTSPSPNVIFVAIPETIHKGSTVAQLPNNQWLNLRRGLKARSMKWGVPIQVIWEDVLTGKRASLQDKATRAWNTATALYYKANGIPWRGHGLEQDTCYVGVTFYQAESADGKPVMRSGVAQAFDYLGQGVVLRGDPFEWDVEEHGRTPHLSRDAASKLMQRTLAEYRKISRLPPKRVVVHKSSRFWGTEHPQFNELEGFFHGIESVNPEASVDLITLAESKIRLARVGQYPPVRGTFALIEGGTPIIYTHGFTPYFNTYPGTHVPVPWTILEKHGDSDVLQIAAELMALTKMNVNNAEFSDGTPITLAFAERVSEVLKQVGPEMPVRSEYSFYM
ncbi:argonaute/piwi family protein [Bradyrhizobium yuanmingense]|uniref:argonaute/piwi family protein n=1 Tax=Bradyrhizobium yuanmingense TaxID=108015 RepID=UPI003516B5FA